MMKKKMKRMGSLLFTIILHVQALHAQMISLTAARTPVPGVYAGLRYSHYTNSEINLAAGVFYESANPARLRYASAGAEALAEFQSARDPSVRFGWKAAVGLQRLNVARSGELRFTCRTGRDVEHDRSIRAFFTRAAEISF
jgi:hypothetical protein